MTIDRVITLEAGSEFHEPKPYEHYPAILVNGYCGSRIDDNLCIYHGLVDIKDGEPFDNHIEAIAAARTWIENKVNIDAIIQEIIAKIGE